MINDNHYKIFSDSFFKPFLFMAFLKQHFHIIESKIETRAVLFLLPFCSTLTLLGHEFSNPQMENVCMQAKMFQLCLHTLHPVDCSPPNFLCPRDSTGKNTKVGCHALLQQMENILLC